ncbi:hypothetical protein F5B21DRAFT_445785 [Xylaria acuta]|nr:hypothetical protein F5B21DRAFT_445785 [Xylaria acuta]
MAGIFPCHTTHLFFFFFFVYSIPSRRGTRSSILTYSVPPFPPLFYFLFFLIQSSYGPWTGYIVTDGCSLPSLQVQERRKVLAASRRAAKTHGFPLCRDRGIEPPTMCVPPGGMDRGELSSGLTC